MKTILFKKISFAVFFTACFVEDTKTSHAMKRRGVVVNTFQEAQIAVRNSGKNPQEIQMEVEKFRKKKNLSKPEENYGIPEETILENSQVDPRSLDEINSEILSFYSINKEILGVVEKLSHDFDKFNSSIFLKELKETKGDKFSLEHMVGIFKDYFLKKINLCKKNKYKSGSLGEKSQESFEFLNFYFGMFVRIEQKLKEDPDNTSVDLKKIDEYKISEIKKIFYDYIRSFKYLSVPSLSILPKIAILGTKDLPKIIDFAKKKHEEELKEESFKQLCGKTRIESFQKYHHDYQYKNVLNILKGIFGERRSFLTVARDFFQTLTDWEVEKYAPDVFSDPEYANDDLTKKVQFREFLTPLSLDEEKIKQAKGCVEQGWDVENGEARHLLTEKYKGNKQNFYDIVGKIGEYFVTSGDFEKLQNLRKEEEKNGKEFLLDATDFSIFEMKLLIKKTQSRVDILRNNSKKLEELLQNRLQNLDFSTQEEKPSKKENTEAEIKAIKGEIFIMFELDQDLEFPTASVRSEIVRLLLEKKSFEEKLKKIQIFRNNIERNIHPNESGILDVSQTPQHSRESVLRIIEAETLSLNKITGTIESLLEKEAENQEKKDEIKKDEISEVQNKLETLTSEEQKITKEIEKNISKIKKIKLLQFYDEELFTIKEREEKKKETAESIEKLKKNTTQLKIKLSKNRSNKIKNKLKLNCLEADGAKSTILNKLKDISSQEIEIQKKIEKNKDEIKKNEELLLYIKSTNEDLIEKFILFHIIANEEEKENRYKNNYTEKIKDLYYLEACFDKIKELHTRKGQILAKIKLLERTAEKKENSEDSEDSEDSEEIKKLRVYLEEISKTIKSFDSKKEQLSNELKCMLQQKDKDPGELTEELKKYRENQIKWKENRTLLEEIRNNEQIIGYEEAIISLEEMKNTQKKLTSALEKNKKNEREFKEKLKSKEEQIKDIKEELSDFLNPKKPKPFDLFGDTEFEADQIVS